MYAISNYPELSLLWPTRKKVQAILDGVETFQTRGMISGGISGLMLGSDGLGLGYGVSNHTVNMNTYRKSRLQEKLGSELEEDDDNYETSKVIWHSLPPIFMMMFIAFSAKSCISPMMGDFGDSSNKANQLFNSTETQNLLEDLLLSAMLIGILMLLAVFFYRFIVAINKDSKHAVNEKKRTKSLNEFLPNLHICEHCYIVYDHAGFFTRVQEGAVTKLYHNSMKSGLGQKKRLNNGIEIF